MRIRKGISPVIATVILVAVTLVIAVAIIGWLMGLWGGLAGGSPAISITNQKVDTLGNIVLYIKNTGGGSDKLLSAEIISAGSIVGSATEGSTVTINGESTTLPATITANFAGWVTIPTGVSSLNAGDTVIVKLYFESSGTQQFQVTVIG